MLWADQLLLGAHDNAFNVLPSPSCLLQYRCTQTLAVDIHPAAKIGKGVLLDHGTGLVIGETAVVGNNVSILHNVTLGGLCLLLNLLRGSAAFSPTDLDCLDMSQR